MIQFTISLFLLVFYVYYGILLDVPSLNLLIMAVGFALAGAAEFLPTERRRTAGVLRVSAILLLIGLLALIVFAPEILFRG
ncbi:hypothetical protein CP557_12910 [Natrinema ejinorense]|uniref:Uncharacterized protein n=1 Tax=Natrinema ejinorense TaxID=373386 RepID=A0A2A5R103_9EURY|nr:hypothetical protein CP557_12910 [Natrinema ejinorense]